MPEMQNGQQALRSDLEAWRERVAIVRFCSGREMTDRQAQRIVQRQMGWSDDEAAQMARQDAANEP